MMKYVYYVAADRLYGAPPVPPPPMEGYSPNAYRGLVIVHPLCDLLCIAACSLDLHLSAGMLLKLWID